MNGEQGQSSRRTRIRCLLGAHRWTTRVNGGARWQECKHCGTCKKQIADMANRFPPGGFGDGGGSGW